MAQHDAQIAGAESASGFDEFAFPRCQNLPPDQPCVTHPSAERERNHEIEDSGAAKGDERDRDQDSGKRKECVHQHHIHKAVNRSSVVSGDGTDDQSEDQRGENDAAADQHRNARTVDEARQDIAAQFIGAQPVRRRRRTQPSGKLDRGGILRCDPGSEQRKDNEYQNEHDPNRRQRIVARVSRNAASQ